jgi:NHL repeat
MKKRMIVNCCFVVSMMMGSLANLVSMERARAADFVAGAAPDVVMGKIWKGVESLTGPEGVAIDPVSGKVFVADTQGNRVLRYAAGVQVALGVPGTAEAEMVFGQPDFSTTEATTTQTGLAHPEGVAVDAAGDLYVVDTRNSRVVRYRGAATAVTGVAADGVLGQPGYTTSTAGAGTRQMSEPRGLAILGNFLAVADTKNHRVLVFRGYSDLANGDSADFNYGETGLAGTTALRFSSPTCVALSPSGSILVPSALLWVGDTGNRRVLRFAKFPPVGANFTTGDGTANGVLGAADFTTLGGAGRGLAEFIPGGLAIEGSRLYVSDFRVDGSGGNQRVLRFEAALTKPNGAASDGTVGVDASSKPVSLGQPRQLAVKDGNVWVADFGFSRVARYDAPATVAFKQDPEWTMGNIGGRFSYHDISDMTEDPLTGKFFVCWRREGIVQRFASAAAFRAGTTHEVEFGGLTVPLGLDKPSGIRILRGQTQRTLVVADTGNHRLILFSNATTTTANRPPPSEVIGQPDFITNTPAPAGILGVPTIRFNQPTGIDACGYEASATTTNRFTAIAIANTQRNSVMVIYRMNGANEWSNFGSVGNADGSAGTAERAMTRPQGVAFGETEDSMRNFWVADTGNHRIIQFEEYQPTVLLGQPNYTTSVAGAGVSGLNQPTALAFSRLNNGLRERLYALDQGNQRALEWAYTSSNDNSFTPTPRVAFGALDAASARYSPPSTKALSAPLGMMVESYDAAHRGSIFISDPGQERASWWHRPAQQFPEFVSYRPLFGLIAGPALGVRWNARVEPGYTYLVEKSRDLVSWNTPPATEVTVPWTGTASDQHYEFGQLFTDETGVFLTKQFLRIREK